MVRSIQILVLPALLTLLAVVSEPNAVGAEPRVQFNRQIRPILSDACFQCHGPDEAKRQGGLRLDLADAAKKGGDSGPAWVSGKPDESELWKRITSANPNLLMPPPKSGKSLKPEQIATLKRWIIEGAEYQGHWAFLRVERPAVPHSTDVTNPIDVFIRERLHLEGLKWSPEASRETLIRRVTLDLTGLPPTPAEVDAFFGDASHDAYEKVVDRLLNSPHYGERMAQQWLDFARYADSNGFQVDSSRQMSGWRDWVIAAFNRNLPFDQFTIEQLAGDLLPNASREQIIASGFHRNGKLNGEGGRIQEEWFAETVIDRVETTGLTWMGLTLNCCRCHDHKYDPITQKEFYQLFAFFNSVDESGVLEVEGGNTRPVQKIPSPDHEKRLAELNQAIVTAESKLTELKSTSPTRQGAWEIEFAKQLAENPETWRLLVPTEVKSVGGASLTRQPDNSWLASGTNPNHDEYVISGPIAQGQITALLLEAFPDLSLPNQSLGRYPNGNFVLTDVNATISAASLANPVKATITRAVSDYDQPGWPVQAIVDGKGQGKNSKGWAVDGPTKRENRKAMFVFSAPIAIPPEATITISLKHDAIAGHNIGRFRLSTTTWPGDKIKLDGVSIPNSLRQAIGIPKSERTAAQLDEIAIHFRQFADAAIKQGEQSVADARKAVGDYENSMPTVMVMQELATPREAFLLKRGQYDLPGEKVSRAVPLSLPRLPEGSPVNRLGLARWLVSREHPLTARVWVNCAWERFFGTGLVRTTENLGSQSEWPSHPELLDWLAAEFMEEKSLPAVAGNPTSHKRDNDSEPDAIANPADPRPGQPTSRERLANSVPVVRRARTASGGPRPGQPPSNWDMKALQKLILMSATYRQSAVVTSGADPENRLLSRGPRIRLSAETVRDQTLAIAGLLVPKIGGPSVRPYMPEGVWDETSRYGDLRGYKPDVGEGRYRRTLYTIWKRTAPPPSLMLFDAPAREVCTVKRSRTNTPLQALALLNEITYVEAASKFGERMLNEGGTTPEQRLTFGFRLATARRPTSDELAVLITGLNEDLDRFRAAPDAAAAFLKFATNTSTQKFTPAELAAYALTANILLNLDEVVTRE